MEIKYNKDLTVELFSFLFGYKTTMEFEDIFEQTILKIYDNNKPINVSIFILSVFHYLNCSQDIIIKNKKMGNEEQSKFLIKNEYFFILIFYLTLFKALGIEDDLSQRDDNCKNDNDIVNIVATADKDILNYFLLAKVNMVINYNHDNKAEMKEHFIELQKGAANFINDKTIYNKIPKNFKKLFDKAVQENKKV